VAERKGHARRETKETTIEVTIDLEGGEVSSDTGVPFFDHMLEQLGRHAPWGLTVSARGDLEIDAHHTIEDTGIVLGEALTTAAADKVGTRRYGHALVPMEEALARVALDVSGRPLLVYQAEIPGESIGQFETHLVGEFLRALCRSAGLTLHVSLEYGEDPHHCVEAIFKGLARALGDAFTIDPRAGHSVPSTKGIL
jgi:imidazoleglycerol-phosphate dehydratase